MSGIDRRTALAFAVGAAYAIVTGHTESALAAVGDETKIAEGVTVKILSEGLSIIPGYRTVRLRDITMQPGSSFPPRPMMNAMVCHTLEGKLQITQSERKFAADKGFVWTCNVGMTEAAANTGNTVAVMRVADLLPA